MAEAFNEHFTNIMQVLAQEVPAAEVNPEFYLLSTDKSFFLKPTTLTKLSDMGHIWTMYGYDMG